MPAPWDPASGDYATADGWIRLHTNAPHHREAALRVLGVPADKAQVAKACPAGMRMSSKAQWSRAVAARQPCVHSARGRCIPGPKCRCRPLLSVQTSDDAHDSRWTPTPDRPLKGLRVLDLTRVLAGPVATRFLAGLGADVLRIDSPTWDEPGVVPDVTLGKRCARLDLRTAQSQFRELLGEAHVLVHGYRADALDNLGFGTEERRRIRPGLVDVCLNAYGWSGPWRNRRGFDSLVQMSAGIADAGMRELKKERPHTAAGAGTGSCDGIPDGRCRRSRGLEHRQGLPGTSFTCGHRAVVGQSAPPRPASDLITATTDADWSDEVELTEFGPAHRLRSPVQVGTAVMHWDRPAVSLGSSPPEFT